MLNKRLLEITKYVSKQDVVIDVGCDHALLSIYIEQNRLVKKVYASDNKEGPLVKAKENITKYNLNKKIKILLKDGINNLNEDINTIIISGMGSNTIINIIKKDIISMRNINKLILSPNNEIFKLRKFLSKKNYFITYESLIKESNIIYPVLVFERNKNTKKRYKYIDLLLGPILRHEKNKLFEEQNNLEIKKIENILKKLPKKYIMKKLILKYEIILRKKQTSH